MSIIPAVSDVRMATRPAQSQKLEAVSAAAVAYYKEQNDYEGFMRAWEVYLLARRKTTELYKAELESNNMRVTDGEFGFTPMQWSRRLKELSVPQEKIDSYFDELVSNGWQPSINGLLRQADGSEYDRRGAAVAALLRSARYLLDDERTTKNQRHILSSVLAAWMEAA